jgi:PEGA domain
MAVKSVGTPAAPGRTEPKSAAAAGAQSSASSNLTAPTGPPRAEPNRKALEPDAGRHPGKLLLRCAPGNAEVFVNNLMVGRSPLLLIVAPGQYKVGMRGDHLEWGDETVVVPADETQVVLIHLKPRYPSSITLRKSGGLRAKLL